MRRVTTSSVVAAVFVTLLASQVPPAFASSGNAGIHLEKTVDATSLNPVLALTLHANRQQAIPSDTLTYSGTVTNTGATLGLSGRFTAASNADTDATVAYYWDELQTCLTDC